MDVRDRHATVLVVGAGQAGLSAAYHLQRRGFVDARSARPGERSFLVLDAEDGPGGAWRHRWPSLTMATVNGIFDLPGLPKDPVDPQEPSREAVPRYFGRFEQRFDVPVLRPVRVLDATAADEDPRGPLLVRTTAGTWTTRVLINATGTWTNPLRPAYPGQETFLGRQLHTSDYGSAAEFAGHRVAVIGGGISAVQQLEEISRVAPTAWYTRREPVFLAEEFEPETTGRDVIARVTADAEAGNPVGSIVSYTGLAWTPAALAARDRGVLRRRPMFTEIRPHGVVEADGSFTSVDVLLWATGFRPAIGHLDGLHLRTAAGGVALQGTRVRSEPRVHLIGFGPSQSTVGANRAGRDAVAATVRFLDPVPPALPTPAGSPYP